MHITEGVAPLSVALGGGILAAGGVAVGLRRLRDEDVPRAALMAAAIFAAAVLVRLPVGPSSIHPVLNGLAGLLLGWVAVPVFLVCLFLQALLFQFGGLTTLGVNTVIMGFPAVACFALLGRHLRGPRQPRTGFWLGFAAGFTALCLSYGLWAVFLALSGRHLLTVAKLALVPYAVLMTAEGVLTGFVIGFLARVYPQALDTR